MAASLTQEEAVPQQDWPLQLHHVITKHLLSIFPSNVYICTLVYILSRSGREGSADCAHQTCTASTSVQSDCSTTL